MYLKEQLKRWLSLWAVFLCAFTSAGAGINFAVFVLNPKNAPLTTDAFIHANGYSLFITILLTGAMLAAALYLALTMLYLGVKTIASTKPTDKDVGTMITISTMLNGAGLFVLVESFNLTDRFQGMVASFVTFIACFAIAALVHYTQVVICRHRIMARTQTQMYYH